MARIAGQMISLRSWVSPVCARLIFVSLNPSKATTHWRAVCGKTARTVRREGELISISPPYPYRKNPKIASSAEFVGGFGLGKFSELMKQCDFNGFKLFEAVRFSHGQFGFVVEAFDNA